MAITISSSSDIWAKDDKKTLEQHLDEVLNYAVFLIRQKSNTLKTIAQNAGLPFDSLQKSILLASYFHDFGKATVEFQSKVRGSNKKFSHALASVPFILATVYDNPIAEIEGKPFYPEVIAVATHHTNLHNSLFNDFAHKFPKYYTEFLIPIGERLNEKLKNYGFDFEMEFELTKFVGENPFHLYIDCTDLKYFNLNNDYESIRVLYLAIKGILNCADWYASGGEDIDYALNTDAEKFTQTMQKYPEFKNWYSFQKECRDSIGDIFIQIPTGQGKTEASLLWALNNLEYRKIIYLLPTMVTTNKMYSRMKELFPEQVGITHSTAGYLLRKEDSSLDKMDYLGKQLINRTFSMPITVATVDQLLYSFFNWRHWEVANINAFNALVVLDEIHLYQPYTLGLILHMMELLKEQNTHFAIMSATFPKFLMESVKEVLGRKITLVSDENYDSLCRNAVHIIDAPIESAIDQIIDDYNAGKKVLVICNTVRKSVEVYQEISSYNSMVYHSQFINRDRFDKEKQLDQVSNGDQPFIAVTTQIVEVSLDIDFDTLYTEMAPIDALVQRMGRVNRKGKKGICDVNICHESEVSYKIYPRNFIELTREIIGDYIAKYDGKITEGNYRDIVNHIYREENLDDDFFDELKEGYYRIGQIHKQLHYIYQLDLNETEIEAKTRKVNYMKIDVVPNMFREEIENLVENGDYWKIHEYTVKIPVWAYKQYYLEPVKFVRYSNIDYDSETGVKYQADEGNFLF